MDTTRFPELVKAIYQAVNELEVMFTKDGKKRHFTPDGHMVGSIGEVLVAYHYNIELFPASHEKHDGKVAERHVQIKATQAGAKYPKVGVRSCPDYLLVLEISRDGAAKEIYNGPGEPVWKSFGDKRPQSNGQHQISLKCLEQLMDTITENDKISRVRP